MITQERRDARAAIRFGFIPLPDNLPANEEVAREAGRGAGLTGKELPPEAIARNDAFSQALEVLGQERFDALYEEGKLDLDSKAQTAMLPWWERTQSLWGESPERAFNPYHITSGERGGEFTTKGGPDLGEFKTKLVGDVHGGDAWNAARESGADVPREDRTYAALREASPLYDSPEEHPVEREGNYATLSGEKGLHPGELSGNDALVNFLLDHGVDPDQMEAILGHYGQPGEDEDSIIVYDPPEELLTEAGRRFGQDSVMFVNGKQNRYVYTNGDKAGKSHVGSGHDRITDPKDNWSRARVRSGDLFWSNILDFDKLIG